MTNASSPRGAEAASLLHDFLDQQGVRNDIFNYDFENPTSIPDLSGRDLLIVIGGDGTLLRAGHMCARLGIPLLGVQAGRLGFLVEISRDDWPDLMVRLLAADYRLESRMMLTAELIRGGQSIGSWDVLNELVVCRGREVRPIEVRVDLSEGYLTSYRADGLIVSTATGSTAYALAVGGPILPPELRNMLIIPIAPHLSLDRGVVLAEGADVVLRASSDHEVILSVDGMEPVQVLADDYIHVTANSNSLKMIRFGEANYFYRDLAALTQHNPVLKVHGHD